MACADGLVQDEGPDQHSESDPCEDTPANGSLLATNRAVSAKNLTLLPLMAMPLLHQLTASIPVAPKVTILHGRPAIAASPPSLMAIRTVVLLV